jgi:membrane protease YdiL (CAAX protease family)
MVERAAEAGFLVLLIAGVPAMSYLTAHDPQLRTLPRRALYLSAALSEWFLAALGLAAARVAHLDAAALGFRAVSFRSLVGWTAAIGALATAGLAVVLALERRGWWPEESELVRLLMPETRAEKAWAVAVVAPTAAIAEEFLYRGYLLAIVGGALHSVKWAWAVSAVAFGLAHVYQRPNGMVRAGLLGALLAWPVVRTTSLYPSILAHFLIDAAAFGWLGSNLTGRHSQAPDR